MVLQLTLPQSTTSKLPSFEQTLAALGQIPEFLFRALEFGTSQNRLFFETLSNDERPRPHLREMIVRDQGKRFLERNEFQVDEDLVGVGNEPLSALLLRCGPVQIRVLKAADGLAPGCGDSFRRRRFYNQAPDFYRDSRGKTYKTKLNLLFLWNFDPSFNLGQVWLTCPMRAGETSEDVVTHFHELLPHPAFASAGRPAEEARSEAEQELERLLGDVPGTEPEEESGNA
jgi:hypothetical protein